MAIRQLVQEAVAADLKSMAPRHGGENYALWERKTLNMHRGVVLLEIPSVTTDAKSLVNRIRSIVASEFDLTWAWLRGFAYGAIISAPTVPEGTEALLDAIDRYNRSSGVFQWLVFVSKDPHVAFGAHMWAEGYLAATFRRLVQGLESRQIACPVFVDAKGAFFEFAMAIRKLPVREFQKDS